MRARGRSEGPTARALVALRGTVHCRIDAGTHTVLILDVNETCARVGSPLLYFERGYGSLVRT